MQLTQRFEDAVMYATRVHAAQVRKGSNTPYIAHLLGVAALVLEANGDEDQAIAALLHDAVEDQGGEARLADVRARYGERVGNMVSDCTDAVIIPKPAWRPRKEAYIASLEHKPLDSLLVSLCDKIYNAEAIVADLHGVGSDVWERFSAPTAEVCWYYEALAAVFERRVPGSASGRLSRAVHAMKAGA